MKSFLRNCLFFVLPVLVAFVGIGFIADGYTDEYYLKFTSPRQKSLIIGSSRASQTLQPAIINPALRGEYKDLNIFNFGFNINISPFGKVYLDAIKKKLDPDTKNGLFIITVDAWSVSGTEPDPENVAKFWENNGILGRTTWMNMNPNLQYLVNSYRFPYTKIVAKRIRTSLFHIYPAAHLHNDGWMEITVPMDSASIARRTAIALDIYLESHIKYDKVSVARKSYLIQTIAFLKEHGDVFLVKLPVYPQIAAIGQQYYPGFDAFIDSVARAQKITWFNFTDSCSKYTYTDGSHIWKESGALISKQLADLIIKYRHSR